MKNIKFLAIALIVIASYSNKLFAQVAAVKNGPTDFKYDMKKNVKCRVIPNETGGTIALEYDVKSPRDASSGLATGRRSSTKPTTKFFEVSSSSNAVTEVKRPKNPVSGQTITQKGREGKIAVIAVSHGMAVSSDPPVTGGSSSDAPPSEIAIDEPGVQKVSSSGMGAGKASFSDLSVMSAGKATFKEFTVTKRCDGKTTKISCPDGECDIPLDDCPNGTCDLVCSWSWGATNTGSMSSGSGSGSGRCVVDFSLEVENGVCTAITKKDAPKGNYDLATGKK